MSGEAISSLFVLFNMFPRPGAHTNLLIVQLSEFVKWPFKSSSAELPRSDDALRPGRVAAENVKMKSCEDCNSLVAADKHINYSHYCYVALLFLILLFRKQIKWPTIYDTDPLSIISSSIYHRKCIFWLLWLVCLRQRAYCHIPHISQVCTLGATLT